MNAELDTSPLHRLRREYGPKLPTILRGPIESIAMQAGNPLPPPQDAQELEVLFPCSWNLPQVHFINGNSNTTPQKYNVGVVLSGGQAPGGHNVICGLRDAMHHANPQSILYGFIGGPGGLLAKRYKKISPKDAYNYRNSGGFDLIQSGRTKIETPEQFRATANICRELNLDALVIVGGDDSNTNAAMLAEYFKAENNSANNSANTSTAVIGAPKTIDGDLKNTYIELSFGFDTATKTYSELIGNICRDAKSAAKYWHFIKLMGRSASHIALECALQTHPNVCIISEEVAHKKQRLADIVAEITNTVIERHKLGQHFGVVLVPEGLIEFIPEIGKLIRELNEILATQRHHFEHLRTFEDQAEFVNQQLGMESSYAFSSLPFNIQRQLLLDRDPHGNVQVSRIETEQLLIDMVQSKLSLLADTTSQNIPFATQHHFLGYEGRCAYPTNFDADYCYTIGHTALHLIANRLSGYMVAIRNLKEPATEWVPTAIPIVSMMNIERRHGTDKPVIRKGLVSLESKSFQYFSHRRAKWAGSSSYRYPGAIQYFGPPEVVDAPPLSLKLDTT